MSNKGHNDEGELHFEQIKHSEVSYEDRDLGARAIIVFLVVLGITGVLLCAMVWGYFDYHIRKVHEAEAKIAGPQVAPSPNLTVAPPEDMFPKPALQIDDVADMNRLRAADSGRLNSYGWVDQSAGIAHIPIDKAMDQIAAQGLPTRPAPTQAGQQQTGQTKAGQQAQPQVADFGSGDDTVAGAAGGVRPANNR